MSLSRQRRWQLRKRSQGRCIICGCPRGKRGTGQHCRRHADAFNAFKRAGKRSAA